jgi:hypothetical protein
MPRIRAAGAGAGTLTCTDALLLAMIETDNCHANIGKRHASARCKCRTLSLVFRHVGLAVCHPPTMNTMFGGRLGVDHSDPPMSVQISTFLEGGGARLRRGAGWRRKVSDV